MLKLIIVEDEPAVRRELALLTPWEDMGLILSGEAADGIEALALADRVKPDIVVTDIRMPGMDGLALIEELDRRAQASGEMLPEIIVLSGYSEFEYARAAMHFGVCEYLLKPVEDDAMRAAVEKSRERIEARSVQARVARSVFAEYEPGGGQGCRDGYVDGALRLINERYIQGVSIEEAAAELRISAGHLSRVFRQETGYTFVDYLMRIRIKRAAELLRDPMVKIYEVADLVGYSDARYFARIFKKITGFTPKEFKDGAALPPRSSG